MPAGEREGGQGEGPREVKEAERCWMVQGMRKKKAEKLEKAGEVRRIAGRRGPPVPPHKKVQLQPTKAKLPEHFSGFQMTILAIH
jgi:hypothetical protein